MVLLAADFTTQASTVKNFMEADTLLPRLHMHRYGRVPSVGMHGLDRSPLPPTTKCCQRPSKGPLQGQTAHGSEEMEAGPPGDSICAQAGPRRATPPHLSSESNDRQ